MTKQPQHIWRAMTSLAIGLMMIAPAMADTPAKKERGKGPFANMPSISQSYLPDEETRMPRWAQQKISYSQAKSIAMSRYPGAKYVDTYLDGNVYKVRLLLQNGRRIDVKVDAVTGRIR